MLTDGEASSTVLSSRNNRLTMSLGDGAIQVWIQSIDQAQHSLWVLAYNLDYAPVVAALVQAVERGLDARILIDQHQATKTGCMRAIAQLRLVPWPTTRRSGPTCRPR